MLVTAAAKWRLFYTTRAVAARVFCGWECMDGLLLALVCLYAALAALVWRFWCRRGGARYPLAAELLALTPVLLLHTSLVWLPLIQQRMLVIGFGDALLLVAWLMVLLYWGGSFFYRLHGLQLLLYPLAALMVLPSLLLPGAHAAYSVHNLPFMLHVSAALLAYGLFGIAALLAVLLLWLDRSLHRRRRAPLPAALPPLLSIEQLMFQGVWAGFVLLTVAVVSGTLFAEAVFGQPAALTHKTLFGVLSWLIYAVILWRRHMRAWRGRRAAWWVLVAFGCLLLAYIGSRFVLEVVLQRGVAV